MKKEHKIVFGEKEKQHMKSGLFVIGFFTTLVLPILALSSELDFYNDNILVSAVSLFFGFAFLYGLIGLLVLFIGWVTNKVYFNDEEE